MREGVQTDPGAVVTLPATDTAQKPKPSQPKGSRAVLNFWLDATLGLTVVFIIWVSAMMQIVFPRPTAATGWRLWGMSFDDWRDAQFYAICFCAVLAVEHVVLHWNWICGVIATKILRVKGRPDEGTQAVYGVGTFIGILLVLNAGILAAMFCVQQPPR